MEVQWFYTRGLEQYGPYTWDELVNLSQHNYLDPEDLVWTQGMKEWVPAEKIRGLGAGPPPPSPFQRSPDLPPTISGGYSKTCAGGYSARSSRREGNNGKIVLVVLLVIVMLAGLILTFLYFFSDLSDIIFAGFDTACSRPLQYLLFSASSLRASDCLYIKSQSELLPGK